jgi:hypothetical protein
LIIRYRRKQGDSWETKALLLVIHQFPVLEFLAMSISGKLLSSPLLAFLIAIAVPVTGVVVSGSRAVGPSTPRHSDVKIGTYESRAIAIAWAASPHNPVGEKMKEYEAAKKEGNKAKVAELEAWGPAHQRVLHFQGFGNVPVSDLLSPVENKMKDLLREKNLAAIAQHCNAVAETAETVDITDDLVLLFEPSQRTLDMVKEIRGRQPLSLLELAEIDSNQ